MHRKQCKFPDCRKMVSYPDTEPQTIFCCKDHIKYCSIYDKPEECPICCSEFTQPVPLFPCSHWVCKECVIKSGKEECPVCRQPVDIDKKERTQLQRVAKHTELEKRQQQLEEDRRIAYELQQQLQEEERRTQPIMRIVVTQENMNEILQILGALDNGERTLYLHALGMLGQFPPREEDDDEEE